MHTSSFQKKHRGIGLLELMLALTIIAVILVMATRFYQVADRSRYVNSAFNDIEAVVTASHSWWEDQGHDFTKLKNIRALVEKGYLQPTFARNPWGGQTTVRGKSADQVEIKLTNVELQACNALRRRLNLKGLCALTIGTKAIDFKFCSSMTKRYEDCNS